MTRLTRAAVFDAAALYGWAITLEADGQGLAAMLWTGTSPLSFSAPLGFERAERADRSGEAVLRIVLDEGEPRELGTRTSGVWPRVVTETRALCARPDPRTDLADETPTARLEIRP